VASPCHPRPRLLDLYCGAGGASKGYELAGFEVVGVDTVRQTRYPGRFVLGDALAVLEAVVNGAGEWDAIHASPPCKLYTRARVVQAKSLQLFEPHADYIEPTRELLEQLELPWIIENVPEAPIRADVVLCGTMFGLRSGHFELRRHRHFELGNWWPSRRPPPCQHRRWRTAMPVHGHSAPADFYRRFGNVVGKDERAAAMGIDWMSRDELSSAIPPAFTRWLGGQLLEELGVEPKGEAA
jgi:DNA (cytosine-5)-methyltransferase 1